MKFILSCILTVGILLPVTAYSQYKPAATQQLQHAEGLLDTPNVWVLVQRDDSGYLIYEPCDGDLMRIVAHNGNFIIYWQLEQPDTFAISSVSYSHTAVSVVISGGDKNGLSGSFEGEIVDEERKLVLWRLDIKLGLNNFGSKVVTTTEKYAPQFRFIDNPCPENKIVEHQFLPVEFD